MPVLWIYGADAVGKSTVGWELYTLLVDRGHAAAYLDTDYLGFCTPQPEDRARLVEANLAGLWPNFQEAGADLLVVSGIMITEDHRRRFESAIANSHLHLTLLTASAQIQRERVLGRADAEAQTRGQTVSSARQQELESYAESSAAFARLLKSTSAMADLILDSDIASPAELAEQISTHWASEATPSRESATAK